MITLIFECVSTFTMGVFIAWVFKDIAIKRQSLLVTQEILHEIKRARGWND